jgi:hypothetical protein
MPPYTAPSGPRTRPRNPNPYSDTRAPKAGPVPLVSEPKLRNRVRGRVRGRFFNIRRRKSDTENGVLVTIRLTS